MVIEWADHHCGDEHLKTREEKNLSEVSTRMGRVNYWLSLHNILQQGVHHDIQTTIPDQPNSLSHFDQQKKTSNFTNCGTEAVVTSDNMFETVKYDAKLLKCQPHILIGQIL